MNLRSQRYTDCIFILPVLLLIGGDDGGRSVEVSSGGEASNSDSDDWEEEEEHSEGPNAMKRFQGSQDHTPDPTDGDQVTRVSLSMLLPVVLFCNDLNTTAVLL